MSTRNLKQRFPAVVEVLKTRGRRYKSSRGAATDVTVRCPCCMKQRKTTDWALELHELVGKSPAGWCRICAMTLSNHSDWLEILPALWKKHGEWTHHVLQRFTAIRGNSKRRELDFTLDILDIPVLPTACPVFPWVEFIKPTKPQERRGVGRNKGWKGTSPSLDRIDPSLGYIKGNVRWISTRANTLRSNATIDELEALWLDSLRLIEV
jgi:hypothetical protein